MALVCPPLPPKLIFLGVIVLLDVVGLNAIKLEVLNDVNGAKV